MAFLLSREIVEHLCKGGKFSLDLYGEFGVPFGIMNFLVDEVSDLLNNFYTIPP